MENFVEKNLVAESSAGVHFGKRCASPRYFPENNHADNSTNSITMKGVITVMLALSQLQWYFSVHNILKLFQKMALLLVPGPEHPTSFLELRQFKPGGCIVLLCLQLFSLLSLCLGCAPPLSFYKPCLVHEENEEGLEREVIWPGTHDEMGTLLSCRSSTAHLQGTPFWEADADGFVPGPSTRLLWVSLGPVIPVFCCIPWKAKEGLSFGILYLFFQK